MDTKDTVHENDEPPSSESTPNANVKGSDPPIEYMLYILGGYNLAPTPLPSDLIALWSTTDIDTSQPCEFCNYKTSKINFPRVDVDFKARKINFISLRRACERCYRIIDLKGLLNLVIGSFGDKKEEFTVAYNHFLTTNKLKESIDNPEPGSLKILGPENNVIFQDLVSMAYSLYLIMRKSLRILSDLRNSFISDYGKFLGTEFFLKRKDDLKEEFSSFSEEPSKPSLILPENNLWDKSKISTIISNLTLNFSRRVPSKIKPVLEASIEENIHKIAPNDILDLVISLRKCGSFSSKLFKLFLERINEEIKQINSSNYDYVNFVLKTALELIEYNFESLKLSRRENETLSKIENNSNDEDLVDNNSVNNIFKFICDNMSTMKIDDLFRLVPVFFSIQTEQGPPFITINGEYLSNLTQLILDYKLFSSSQHSGNTNIFGPNSLYTCNILVKISKLYFINHIYYLNNSCSNNLGSESDHNETVILDKENHMNKLKEYLQCYIYPIISENITKFTSDNIVELVEVIRRLGEPYPTTLIDRIASVYVKHISQYSIENMLKLVEEFNLMNIKNELVMLNTIITLPRKVTTLDSFDRVIKLLEVFKNYQSEYLDTFISEQIYQIYHKINKKYLNRINKLIGE